MPPRRLFLRFKSFLWTHILRRHQPDIVTKRLQFAIEVMVMRANAGFHADRHGCMLASRTSTWPLPFLLQYDTAAYLADHVERVLTNIGADYRDRAVELACSFAPLPASLTAVLEHGRTIPMIGLHQHSRPPLRFRPGLPNVATPSASSHARRILSNLFCACNSA